jgi:predicted transcriptional regulator
MTLANSSTNDRALTLLGQGLGPEVVASALGVTTSAISQLLSQTEFAAKVAEARFRNLSKHNERDNAYDKLEDELIEKMKDLMPFMVRPMEVAKVLQIINAAKRRGASAPEHITNQQTVINLTMPTQILHRFVVNTANQVVQAGQQALITVQSGQLPHLVDTLKKQSLPHVEYHTSNASPTGGG